MCDCVQPLVILQTGAAKSPKLGQIGCSSKLGFLPLSGITIGKNLRMPRMREKPLMNVKVCSSLDLYDSNGFDFSSEMRLKEGKDEEFEMGLQNGGEKLRNFIKESEDDDLGIESLKREKQYNPKYEALRGDNLKGDDLIGVVENGKREKLKEELKLKPKGKQLMKRSSMLAKQVIGIQSALAFGFITQLWVDTSSWLVLEVEVRPNLLSSESGKFLLEDIKRIGDVVLVQDDRIMLYEFRPVGLETLVGYNVVTPGQAQLGKVRGYTFDINSGAVESLELDAFGYSIIPSSLVSTYALLTEDVLEVVSDTVIVHEAAASRIQRLTKGFLGTNSTEISSINRRYNDLEEESRRPNKSRKSRRKSSKRKFYRGISDLDDDLELPMDYM